MALTTPCWECWEVLGSAWTWGTMSREPGMGLQGDRTELGDCHQLFCGAGGGLEAGLERMLPASLWGSCLHGAGGACGRDALSHGSTTDYCAAVFLMPQGCPWVWLGHGGAVVSAGVWQGGRCL